MKIEIDICAFDSALSELVAIDKFASRKAEVKSRSNVGNVDMLTVACMANGVYQDLVGYLSESEMVKLKAFKVK